MHPAQHADLLQLGEVAAHGFAGDSEAFGQVCNTDLALQGQLFGDEAVAFFGKHDVGASGLCDASHGDLCSYDFRRTVIAMSTQNNTKPNKHRFAPTGSGGALATSAPAEIAGRTASAMDTAGTYDRLTENPTSFSRLGPSRRSQDTGSQDDEWKWQSQFRKTIVPPAPRLRHSPPGNVRHRAWPASGPVPDDLHSPRKTTENRRPDRPVAWHRRTQRCRMSIRRTPPSSLGRSSPGTSWWWSLKPPALRTVRRDGDRRDHHLVEELPPERGGGPNVLQRCQLRDHGGGQRPLTEHGRRNGLARTATTWKAQPSPCTPRHLSEQLDNWALATIVHEMGHAHGLDHRLDRSDLMNSVNRRQHESRA